MKIIKWEYKIIKYFSAPRGKWKILLDLQGDEGWELVTVATLHQEVYFYFKRPCGYVDKVV